MVNCFVFLSRLRDLKMCSVSSLYGDQAITGLLKSCKGWGKVLWEIQFEFKIQIDMDHSNILLLGPYSTTPIIREN